MKNIKLILTAFAAVLLISSTTFAQRGEQVRKSAGMMAEKLGLTDEQATKVEAIQETFRTKVKELRLQGGDRETIVANMKELNTEREAAIKTVLTAEQATKWETMKAERERTSTRPMLERPSRPKVERPEGTKVERPRPKVERPEGTKVERPEGTKVERPTRPKVERPEGTKVERPTRPKAERPQKPRGGKVDKLQQELGLTDTQASQMKKVYKAHKAKLKELKESGAKRKKVKAAKKVYKSAVAKILTPEQFSKWEAMRQDRKKSKKK